MPGHPILVNLTAIALTIPTVFTYFAHALKDEVVEFKNDVRLEVAYKKALLRNTF